MTGRYKIFQGSHPVGVAEVLKEGLYFRFRCSCHLSGAVIYKVSVQIGEHIRDLGILVPEKGVYILETKVPMKYFSSGLPRFSAVPHFSSPIGKFIPISPEEPFAYLARLRKAHMEKRDEIIGIVLES